MYLIKGNSNKVLKEINMSKIDYVFLDGGHAYETVKNDLECCLDVVNSNGTVLCDDYDLGAQAPEVKRAIDELVQKNQLNYFSLLKKKFYIFFSSIFFGNSFLLISFKIPIIFEI